MKQKLPNEKGFLSINEAAGFLKVSTKTLRRWEQQGILTSIRTKGGHRRYSLQYIQNIKNTGAKASFPKTKLPKKSITYKQTSTPHTSIKLVEESTKLPQFTANIIEPISKNNLDKKSFSLVAALSVFVNVLKYSFVISSILVFSFLTLPRVSSFVTKNIKNLTSTNSNSNLTNNGQPVNHMNGKVLAESKTNINPTLNVNVDTAIKGNIRIDGNTILNKDLAINGTNITSSSPNINLFDSVGIINIGATTGTTTLRNNLSVGGNTNITGNLQTGDITKIKGITYSFPTTQGNASTYLKNNGSGTLTWSSITVPSALTDLSGVLPISQGGTNNSSSYTSGSIIFSDGSKLNQNNTYLFWDNTNVRLGLGGTTSPNETLDARGRIYLGDTTAPSTTTNRLYSVSGSLFWNGTSLSGGSGTVSGTSGQIGFFNGATSITSETSGFGWNTTTKALTISGTAALTPTGNSNALTITGSSITSANLINLDARNTSGTLVNLAYGAATSLSGSLTGQLIDLNSGNLTATNQSVTGFNAKLPTLTDTSTSGTNTLTGILVNFGSGSGINQNGAGGTLDYIGGDFRMPALTQTAGTLNAYGVEVTTPSSITTGGTAYGLYINPTGVGAGTLNGINIGTITGSTGTEDAIAIAAGWDSVLKVGSTTVINGSGVVQVAGGGTNIASYAAGDMIYATGTTTLTALAGGAANNGKVLTVTAGLPTWGTISGSSCTDCLVNDPTSSTTNTIAPTGQTTTGLIVKQTSTASPTNDIFQITNSTGGTKYFYVDNAGNVSTSATSGQTLTLTPTTDTTALTLVGTNVATQPLQYINSKNASTLSGILNMAYGAAQTLTGSVTGIKMDLSTNVTATNQAVTGQSITLPAVTNTITTGTKSYTGLSVSAGGGINQNGTGGTTTFAGVDVTIPAITQTLGTLTANGYNVTTPTSITTAGTANGLNVTASGIGAGTLNGINIGAITGGSGTENALQIGSGWDYSLYLNDTATKVRLADGGIITISDGTNTLCTITDAGTTGNLSCTGNITGGTSGTSGFWSRSGTTLSPATANDIASITSTSATALLTLSPTGATGIGLATGVLSGATANTGISIGAITAAATANNFGINIGAITPQTSATAYSINTAGIAAGAGTATYGINLGTNASTATTNYGIFVGAISGAGTTNYGGYIDNLSGGTTSKGLFIGTNSSATATGVDIGALSGATANLGLTIGAISGAGTASAINTGTISSTGATAQQINLGTITGANATSHSALTAGNISGTTATATGITLGTLTGGTTANYQISTGVLTSATTTTNAQLNLGGIVTTGGTNSYGVNIGAISGTGTTNYGINIATLTSTGTTSAGINIGGLSGAATTNYGINIGSITGGSSNYGIFFNNAPANGSINTAAATNLNINTGTTGIMTLDTGTTGAINIGTGANAKTITIGNNTTSTALALTSGTGSQTFTSSVVSTGTTSSAWVFTGNALTTGTGMYINSSSITTGDLLKINASSTTLTSGYLLDVQNNSSSVFTVGAAQITSALPHQFTAAGDVSIAYDILFTNPTSSFIKSAAPLNMVAGETFNSSSLTLRTYNLGNILLDSGSSSTGTGKIGIGPSVTPVSLLHVSNTNENTAGLIGKALAIFDQNESQDILTASAAGVTKMKLTNAGVIALNGGTAGGDLTTLSSAAGTSLNILPSTPTSTGAGTNLVLTGGAALTTGAGGAANLTGGAGAGGTSSGGTASIDAGAPVSTGTALINIGTTNATSITVGSTTEAGTITLGQSTASNTINIGNALTAAGNTQTINIGAGALNSTGLSAITIGNSNLSTGVTTVTIKTGTTGASTGPFVTLGATASTTGVCSSLGLSPTTPTAGTAYELRDCSGTPAADYAENYPVTSDINYGDVVTTGTDLVNTYAIGNGEADWNKVIGQVTKLVKSTKSYQSNIIGVVSDNHEDFASTGYNIKKEDNPMPVALNGRVPVKVASDSEDIQPGDFITSSDTQTGKAMKATHQGYVIGKALEFWNKNSQKETVMIFVNPIYYPGVDLAISGDTSASPSSELANKFASLQSDFQKLNSNFVASDSGTIANLYKINVNKLNVLGDTVLSDTVINGKLNVGTLTFDNTDQSINAIGTLRIQSLALGNIEFLNGLITFDTQGNVIAKSITAEKYKIAGTSAGTGEIPIGQTSVFINSTDVSGNSLIFVTANTRTTKTLAVTQKNNGSGFTVEIPTSDTKDIQFNWWIVDHSQ
ncbi:MAG: MerR family DNA-binding transcriptional regulator [Candidatus Woesebacteria bacterium]|nr:MAG: MerR family DNA-binding transcriptional regulator [Candidatus Woesebacteria bacterium]